MILHHAPTPIRERVLDLAVTYSLAYSGELPLTSTDARVGDCRLVARRTTCGWDVRIHVGGFAGPVGAEFRGAAVMDARRRVRVLAYDPTARRSAGSGG